MSQNLFKNELIPQVDYSARKAKDYFETVDPALRASFTSEQTAVIQALLAAAIPKPNPKLVDLRFTVDLVLARFYLVLFVGKDRRQQQRSYWPNSVSRLGNAIAAVLLLLGLNLLISLFLLLFVYLLKSAAGIDLFPASHLGDQIQRLN